VGIGVHEPALTGGGVGHHLMIAGATGCPATTPSSWSRQTMEHFRDAGFRNVAVEASKQWTSAWPKPKAV